MAVKGLIRTIRLYKLSVICKAVSCIGILAILAFLALNYSLLINIYHIYNNQPPTYFYDLGNYLDRGVILVTVIIVGYLYILIFKVKAENRKAYRALFALAFGGLIAVTTVLFLGYMLFGRSTYNYVYWVNKLYILFSHNKFGFYLIGILLIYLFLEFMLCQTSKDKLNKNKEVYRK